MINEIIFELQKKAIEQADIKLSPVDDFNQSFEIEINEDFSIECKEVCIKKDFTYKAKMFFIKNTRFACPSFMLDDVNETCFNHNSGWNEKLKGPRESELNKILINKFA